MVAMKESKHNVLNYGVIGVQDASLVPSFDFPPLLPQLQNS